GQGTSPARRGAWRGGHHRAGHLLGIRGVAGPGPPPDQQTAGPERDHGAPHQPALGSTARRAVHLCPTSLDGGRHRQLRAGVGGAERYPRDGRLPGSDGQDRSQRLDQGAGRERSAGGTPVRRLRGILRHPRMAQPAARASNSRSLCHGDAGDGVRHPGVPEQGTMVPGRRRDGVAAASPDERPTGLREPTTRGLRSPVVRPMIRQAEAGHARAGEGAASGSPTRLLIISHVIHYRYAGRLHAYAAYAREIDLWADLFPQVLIASPLRDERPPGDCAPFERSNVSIDPQPETGGTTASAKAWQVLRVPYLVYRLLRSVAGADAIHVRCPGNLGL